MTTLFFYLAYLLLQQPTDPPLADFKTPQMAIENTQVVAQPDSDKF